MFVAKLIGPFGSEQTKEFSTKEAGIKWLTGEGREGFDGDVEHALLYLGKEFIWGQMYPQSKQVEDRRQKIRRKWGPIQVYSLNARLFAKVGQHIDNLIRDPKGLPNGKGNRTKLTLANAEKFKLALIIAVGHASVWASRGSLPNRVQGRGRPPDNAVFLFIDDIVRACEGCGLKPGFRYVDGSESLPVRVYIELAPLLWGPVKTPRRLFARWQRLRSTLVREGGVTEPLSFVSSKLVWRNYNF